MNYAPAVSIDNTLRKARIWNHVFVVGVCAEVREEPGGDRGHVGMGAVVDESELLGVPLVDHEGVEVVHNGLLLCGSHIVRAGVSADDRIGGRGREVRPPRAVELSRDSVRYGRKQLAESGERVH